jgi:hypothetical protein
VISKGANSHIKNIVYLERVDSMDGDGEYVERGPGKEESDREKVEDEVCPSSPVSLSNDLTRNDRPSAQCSGRFLGHVDSRVCPGYGQAWNYELNHRTCYGIGLPQFYAGEILK